MSEQNASAAAPSITASAPVPPSVPIEASALVARGFALFPLRTGSKVPAVARDWEHVATTSLLRLRQLTKEPHANYGVACGPSNLVVIDLDVAKEAAPGEPGNPGEPGEPSEAAAHGIDVLRALAGEHGVPRTFTVGTPSGGLHLYFRPPTDGPAPRNTVRRLGPLIDTRGVGGYVVAPGSRVDGVTYRILDDAPIAELPEWISELLRPFEPRPAAGEPLPLATALGQVGARLGDAYARSALARESARVEAARVGTRNDTLNRAAYSLGTLVGSGVLDQALVEAELTRAALAAGLEPRETAGTLRSGLTAGIARPRRLVGLGTAAAAAGPGPGQLSLTGEAEPGEAARPVEAPSRTLIPTLVPQPADWPRVFGRLAGLGTAVSALRRELSVSVPGFALPPSMAQDRQDSGGRGPRESQYELVELLDDLDAAYDVAARAGSALAGSARWLGIQTLADLLRDVRDELDGAVRAEAWTGAAAGTGSGTSGAVGPGSGTGARTGSWRGAAAGKSGEAAGDEAAGGEAAGDEAAAGISAQAFALVRALTTVAARRIVLLTREIAVKLGADGLGRSPLGGALRRTQRAAEAIVEFGAPPAPLTPARFATGRGALQAQLAAMRRDLRTAADRPAA